jgi:hypothetical protein
MGTSDENVLKQITVMSTEAYEYPKNQWVRCVLFM